MRARTEILDLSEAQWARLQARVQTEYVMAEGTARVCVVFHHDLTGQERHVEMPVQELATVLTELRAMDVATARTGLPRRPVPSRDQAILDALDWTP